MPKIHVRDNGLIKNCDFHSTLELEGKNFVVEGCSFKSKVKI